MTTTEETPAQMFARYRMALSVESDAKKIYSELMRLIEHLVAQNAAQQDALEELLAIRLHKITKGADEFYRQEQPKAWARAREVVDAAYNQTWRV